MTTFAQLPLHAIVPSPTNPRKHFDQAALDELAQSIKAMGVHTPVLVAGERRYRASVLAKAETIPAMIREMTDDQGAVRIWRVA